MNCRTVIFGTWLFAIALSVGALSLCAQDEPQPAPDAPPKPAGYAFPGIGIGQPEGELQPDLSPLTGMQNATLGSPEILHSYWVPGLQFSLNSFGQSGNWTADNYFIGNLSLLEAWRHATLTVNYSGGGFVSTDPRVGGGAYHQLALAHNFQTKRWLIQISDQFSYIPQSAFGYGGGTNLGVPGVGGSLGTTIPGLGSSYVPNQSILGVGPSYNNSISLQATYTLSRRSSVTVSGSYGILDFVEQGNYNSDTTGGSVGYNYALSPTDTVGLVYRFSSFHFPGNPQAYAADTISVAYGHKVTGRLALRLFMGPEIRNYRIPIGSTSRTTGFSTTAELTYAFQQGTFGLRYNHGLSEGSGVLIGSISDLVEATASRRLTRVWTGSVNFGYARNSSVGGTSTIGNLASYDDWFLGGGVSRPIGRDFSFSVAYTAAFGDYWRSSCMGSGCNTWVTSNTVTGNFQWHPRRFVLP